MDYYKLLRRPHCDNGDFTGKVLSGRGSPCDYRMRGVDSIMTEIDVLYYMYNINYIEFADGLLMIFKDRIAAICEAILRLPYKLKWMCNGVRGLADTESLELMKKAGCVFINYDTESPDDSK